MQNMETTKNFDNKEQVNEQLNGQPNLQEGEEGPFLSLIIKDLNGFYIRYDVIFFILISRL